MDLRELKKEVQSLPDIALVASQFQEQWLKPFSKDSTIPERYSFLKGLHTDTRAEVNKKLVLAQEQLNSWKQKQALNEKLRRLARHLVDIKLTFLQNDPKKMKILARQLLTEKDFDLKKTIQEIKSFETQVQRFSGQYREINELVQKNLSLEESLWFQEMSHHGHLQNLQFTIQKQKSLAQELGKQLLHVTREISSKR